MFMEFSFICVWNSFHRLLCRHFMKQYTNDFILFFSFNEFNYIVLFGENTFEKKWLSIHFHFPSQSAIFRLRSSSNLPKRWMAFENEANRLKNYMEFRRKIHLSIYEAPPSLPSPLLHRPNAIVMLTVLLLLLPNWFKWLSYNAYI